MTTLAEKRAKALQGDHTGGDRTERSSVFDGGSGNQYGDLTFGNIAGGSIYKNTSFDNRISVGDINSSSVIAIGNGAQARVTTGGDQRAAAFARLYQQLDESAESLAVKAVIHEQLVLIEAEVAKGEAANLSNVEGWLTVVARIMPGMLERTIQILLRPSIGVATAVRKVAEHVKTAADGRR